MEKSISFIHAADLHLDSPFKGLSHLPEHLLNEVRQSTFIALDNLVAKAIENQVDFILLVGDLFDNNKQSLKAQMRLKTAFEKLAKHNIDVFLSYGNHDHQSGNLHPITYPNNVHIFPNEAISSFDYIKNEHIYATIYGFSYQNRAVTQNKAIEFEKVNNHASFHIGTLHGSLHGNPLHDPYAPFSLTDLQEKQFDYWALGHIHKREVLSASPPIIYPGNIQGRHRNEAGEKGCYHVELTETNAITTFIPTQEITFESIHADVTHCETVEEIMEVVTLALGNSANKRFIHLTFSSEQQTIVDFEKSNVFTEIIEVVNDRLMEQNNWSYIYTFKLQYNELPQVEYGDFFIGELQTVINNLAIDDTLKDLFEHKIARKYVTEPSFDAIRKQAKLRLLHNIHGSRKR